MSTVAANGPHTSAFTRWLNRRRLRAASSVGSGSHLAGHADIGGGGTIVIGDRFFLLSRPVRSHMFSSPGAVITIGDDVQISYGAAIAAQQSIDIGSNTIVGPLAVIMDNDFHKVGDRDAAALSAPVRIGSNVRIGSRVTILRGSIIGDGVQIMSGSMVSGVIPDGVTIRGVPARAVVAGVEGRGSGIDMAELVQSVLGLSELPAPDDGPAQIPAWDSLGALRLLLAVEETYGVRLDEEAMHAAKTVAALSAMLESRPGSNIRRVVDMADLVQNELGMSERPRAGDGPAEISAWDSLATLRILIAIEEAYGVSLDEREVANAKSVAALMNIVGEKLKG